jgi:hypothetical protein
MFRPVIYQPDLGILANIVARLCVAPRTTEYQQAFLPTRNDLTYTLMLDLTRTRETRSMIIVVL